MFFELSKVRYKSLGRRQYQYFDEDGNLVADVVQVYGGKPRGRLMRRFAPERDYSNTTLRATSPDGAVLFTIARTWDEGSRMTTLCMYSVDGAMAGEVRWEPELLGVRVMKNIWQLVDPKGAVHCDAVQRLISKGGKRAGSPPWHSKKIDYADSHGTKIAFFSGRWMTLERPVPEFLRLLVVASPIAFDLLDGA